MDKMTWGTFKEWVEKSYVKDEMLLDSIHTDTTYKDEAVMTTTITNSPDVKQPSVEIYLHVMENDDE